MMLSFLLSVAMAATHPVRLHGGLTAAGGAAPAGTAGGVMGRVTVHRDRWTIDVHAREAYAVPDDRLMGALFFGGRVPAWGPLHVRAGLAHNHEVPIDVLREEPLLSVLGSAAGIRHRTGLEVGVGVAGQWPSTAPGLGGLGSRLGAEVNVSGAVFPDDQGPRAYVLLDISTSIGLGPSR